VECRVIGYESPGQAIIPTHGKKKNDRSFSCSTIEPLGLSQKQGKPEKVIQNL
jgi:hypothetical protein